MSYGRRFRSSVLAAGLSLLGPAMSYASLVSPTVVTFAVSDDWSTKAWEAARRGDQAALDDLLKNTPANVDPNGPLAKSIKQWLTNVQARETKRAEETARVRKELTRLREADGGDIGLSMALKSAVELSMLTSDKDALLKQDDIGTLIREADAAAKKAETRGDWMMASELYYRLDLLLEDHGTYRDDVKRESQRLGMIRLYAPQRLWDLKNARRNAEIEWRKKQPKDENDKDGKNDDKPLPPYNPMGDDFHQKLEGIDEAMIMQSLRRGFDRHVERTPMSAILRNAIDSVRTMIDTEDLKGVFPGLADAAAKQEFLTFLNDEDDRLAKRAGDAGPADLFGLIPKILTRNDRTVKIPKTALLHEIGNGGMSALDEFSAIIWPDEAARFERNTQGRFVGVGVQIELDPLQNIRIVTPLEGTPAQRAGIRTGDLIKKVNGSSTIGFTLDQAVDVITGPEETQVELTIEREVPKAEGGTETKEIAYKLTRGRIEVATVKGWRRTGPKETDWDYLIDPQSRIGYVRLTQFSDKTDRDFDLAIDAMKAGGLNGLILDLRYNPGGLLDQAVSIASRFVDGSQVKRYEKLIVSTHAKDKSLVQREPAESGHAKLANIPVVVLINEGSASASEIVSGALRDYAADPAEIKAILVGTRSYGKGSVQNVWPLERPGTSAYVKITTQYYYLPSGDMIHRRPNATSWGVKPNLAVDMLPTQLADSLLLRLNADVYRLDEKSAKPGSDGAASSNPDDLLNKGLDLQLQEALVLLQTQVPPAVAGSNTADKPAKN